MDSRDIAHHRATRHGDRHRDWSVARDDPEIAFVSGRYEPAKETGPLSLFLHWFNLGVEIVTNFYASILRYIVTLRLVTILVIMGFGAGIYLVNNVLPSGFIP